MAAVGQRDDRFGTTGSEPLRGFGIDTDTYFHAAVDVDDVHEGELGLLVLGGRRRRLGGGWCCASAFGSSPRSSFWAGEGGASAAGIAPTVGVGLAPLEGVWPVLDLLGASLDLGGLCLAVRFGGGLAAGGALAAAALSRAERRPDMFVCSLTFREEWEGHKAMA